MKNAPTRTREAARDAHLDRYPVKWGQRILNALQGRQMFQGVDPERDPAAANRLAKRRAKNKVARASRKANRR
jgi:hypothetical protein